MNKYSNFKKLITRKLTKNSDIVANFLLLVMLLVKEKRVTSN